MKLEELFEQEQQIDEAIGDVAGAVGRSIKRGATQMARKAGAKVAGKLGMKGKEAELTGAIGGTEASEQLKVEFRNWLGKTGKKLNTASKEELATFLQSKGVVFTPQFKQQFKQHPDDKPITHALIDTAFQGAQQATAARQTKQVAKGGAGKQQPGTATPGTAPAGDDAQVKQKVTSLLQQILQLLPQA